MKYLLILVAIAATLFAQTADDFTISGMVVDHLTNRPLNHILVQIRSTAKGGGDAYALTESDGKFVFLHVPKGKYQLLAEKRSQPPQAFQSDGGYSTAIVVDGEHKTGNIVFPLRSDATLSGTVTGDDSDPIRNAQVDLLRQNVMYGEAQVIQVRSGRTDSSGQFHFGRLDSGAYYVAISATPWWSQEMAFNSPDRVVYPVTFYGDTTDPNNARLIQLPEGGNANVQVTLHTAPAIHVTVPGQNRGIAIFAPGPGGSRIPVPVVYSARAVSDRYISIKPGTSPLPPPPPDAAPDMPQEMTNLAAGRYEIARVAEEGGFNSGSQMVDLVNGSTLNLSNSGVASIKGKIIFEGSRPEEDLEVVLGRGQRGGSNSEISPDGTFEFAKIPPGEYQVHVTTQAFAIASLQAQGARIVRDNLQIPSGASIQLTIHAVATANLASVTGRVTHENAGVPGAMVLLVPDNLANQRLIRRDQSDSDGSFTLADVIPGQYTVIALDDGHNLLYKREETVRPYLAGGVRISVPLDNGQTLMVPLQTRRAEN